jgi:excisionase family DNA binding protein
MEDEAVPVDRAAELFFPYGGLNGDTLRRAIRAGSLKAERLGRRYFVTRQAVNEWRKSCHVVPRGSDSTSGSETAGHRSTSSLTETKSIQPDAALRIFDRLSKGLPITQPKSSSPTEASVALLKSK